MRGPLLNTVSGRWMALDLHKLKERMPSKSLTLLIPTKNGLVAAKFCSSKIIVFSVQIFSLQKFSFVGKMRNLGLYSH